MSAKCRVQYMERLRVIAMISVVFNHIGSTAATDFEQDFILTTGGSIVF